MKRWMSWALTGLCGICWSAEALGHHVVSESGVAWVEPVSVLEVDVSTARFDFGQDRVGQWETLSIRGEWAPLSRVSFGARMPLAQVRFDDGRQARGLGDVSLGTKVNLFSTPHGGLIVSVGLGMELPTGSERAELGNGHIEWSPFVAAASQWSDSFLTFGLLTGRFAPEQADQPAGVHGAVLGPHASTEAVVRAGGAYLWSWGYGSAGAEWIWGPQGALRQGPGTARLELGWTGVEGMRVALGAHLPLWGDARAGVVGRGSVAWIW